MQENHKRWSLWTVLGLTALVAWLLLQPKEAPLLDVPEAMKDPLAPATRPALEPPPSPLGSAEGEPGPSAEPEIARSPAVSPSVVKSKGPESLLALVRRHADTAGGLDAAKLLVASADPVNQSAGLALMAGRGRLAEVSDLSAFTPQTVLAALDASRSFFGEQPYRAFLDRWMGEMGGEQTAGVKAHTLLLEGDLDLGGGRTALDLMEQVNEPAAILVGLRGFVVDPYLDSTTRLEALLRLRERMAFEDYQAFVEHAHSRAAEETGSWPARIARLREHVEGPPAVKDGPVRVDEEFLQSALARPYPTLLQDMELFLRHAAESGRLQAGSPLSGEVAQQLLGAAGSVAEELAARRLADLLKAHAQTLPAP